MTISTLSIPYSTRTQTGFFNINVLSYQEFVTLSERVKLVASDAMRIVTCLEKILLKKNKTKKLVILSQKNSLNFSSGKLANGELTIVLRNGLYYIGFLPYWTKEEIKKFHRERVLFHHCRLDSFSPIPEKIGIFGFRPYLFKLPSEVMIKQINGSPSLINFHLMLLSEYGSNKCALLCSKDPFPPIVPIPFLCPKKGILLPSSMNISDFSKIKIPFLRGKEHGSINLPILSQVRFEQFVRNAGFYRKASRKEEGLSDKFKSHLFMCPSRCSLNSIDGCLQNGSFVFIRNESFLDLGYIPGGTEVKMTHQSFVSSNQSLLEVHQKHMRRTFLKFDTHSLFFLNCHAKLCSSSESEIGSLNERSFFLLADENGENVSLFYVKGDFELKHSDPSNPAAAFSSIGEDGEKDSSSGGLSEKRLRQKEEGESSQESAAALVAFAQYQSDLKEKSFSEEESPGPSSSKLPPKKRLRQKEEGESSQESAAALVAFSRKQAEEFLAFNRKQAEEFLAFSRKQVEELLRFKEEVFASTMHQSDSIFSEVLPEKRPRQEEESESSQAAAEALMLLFEQSKK